MKPLSFPITISLSALNVSQYVLSDICMLPAVQAPALVVKGCELAPRQVTGMQKPDLRRLSLQSSYCRNSVRNRGFALNAREDRVENQAGCST